MAILAKDNGESLSEHTLQCLKIANILLQNLPFGASEVEALTNDLHLALAVHDVGKAAIGFQKSLQKNGKRWGHRHEIISAAFATSLGFKAETIIAIITHHKALPSDGISAQKGCLHREEIPFPDDLTPLWNSMSTEWEKNIPAFTEEWHTICNAMGRNDLAESIKLTPLSVEKKWLKRDKQKKGIPVERRFYASLLRGLLISSDHIASNNGVNSNFMPPNIPILSQYNLVPVQNILRGFQLRCSKRLGNLILRAPTGSGKTLAALLWAQVNQMKNGRLFYALPNRASINSMYLRLKEYFGDEVVGLLHSTVASAIYSIRENDHCSEIINQRIARTLNSLAREMWFPIRVCTPHQILRYTLQGKGWESMLSEFPNSCFIFDEIHAYNPTVTGLTVATAKYLMTQNASCLFLSATMPAFLRKILEDEIEKITFLEPSKDDKLDKQILDQKRHIIEIIEGDMYSNIELIIKEANKAKSTLVVCNHVPSAQLIFQELKKGIRGSVLLLHSQFSKKDRNRIEQSIMKSLPTVLVSTQVVEVSLDIDFEQGFSESAPIDALVQRFGRINRYGIRPHPAKVGIFTEQIGRHNIYNRELVDKSLYEISLLSSPLGEEELIETADNVYKRGYNNEDKHLFDHALHHPRIENLDSLVAGVHHDWVDEIIIETDGTLDLLPESLLGEYNECYNKGLSIEAEDLLVPVGTWRMGYLKEFLNTLNDPWTIRIPYSEDIGLDFKASSPDSGSVII